MWRIAFSLLMALGLWGTGCAHRRTFVAPDFECLPGLNEKDRLITALDRDGDRKITALDEKLGKMSFRLKCENGKAVAIEGLYPNSNLLQELTLSPGRPLNFHHIWENPVDRITRSISELYWTGLTRTIDAKHLKTVLPDTKIPQKDELNLYIPSSDKVAMAHFQKLSSKNKKLKVRPVPQNVEAGWYRRQQHHHGLLMLASHKDPASYKGLPYVVPGGRFNEMYGWDTYFQALGLLADNRLSVAQAAVDHLVYEIEHYGKILNANRSYYLTRSQPPLLTSLILAVHSRIEKTEETKNWLKRAVTAAEREYQSVWMGKERLTELGLSRYFGNAWVIPPEVEPGHFDFVLKPIAEKLKLTPQQVVSRYNAGTLNDPELKQFFVHDQAVRESGHDTTYRWRTLGVDRAADFVTVDLNSLLYKYELDLARIWETELGEKKKADLWRGRSRKRKLLMQQILLDPQTNCFFDYDFANNQRSAYLSATAFYPFWAEDPHDPESRLLTDEAAQQCLGYLIENLEAPGGILASSKASLESVSPRPHQRQWDYPNGWAPHQMIAWETLIKKGRKEDQERLTFKWLSMITKNATDYNGTIPEKFDVVKQSHAVFAEYGNVGTQFSYITREGFGWMNASYQVGLSLLSPEFRKELRDRFTSYMDQNITGRD